MILGITKFGLLHLLQDCRDAEVSLKAMAVSNDEMEVCDALIVKVVAAQWKSISLK